MEKHVSRAQAGDTACAILASAFGEKYHRWISLPAVSRPLTFLEKKKLVFLIAERDHYEIKQTVVKLKSPS